MVKNSRKKFILLLGVCLYFLTTMSKVLVPASIMEELLELKTLSMAQIAILGGAFWYAYAASQLLAGLFADRYGGVRILLIGGTFFVAGTLGFPLFENYGLMLACRIVAGLGAGTVFLGVAKLLADLYSEKYAVMMGVVLFFAFWGIPCGTMPMTALVKTIGWRWAMLLPGVIALLCVVGVALLAPGNIQPTRHGNAFLPFRTMLGNRPMGCVCLACSVVYGAYYMVLTLVGQKSLTDLFSMETLAASRIMLGLTIFVAVMSFGVNALLALFRKRRKTVAALGGICTVLGSLAGYCAFQNECSLKLLLTGYFLLAVPGGFFALYSTMAKELNPPEDTGLAVAVVNFCAALSIALFQNLGGVVLSYFPAVNQIYAPEAYRTLFGILMILALIGVAVLLPVPETRKTTVRN